MGETREYIGISRADDSSHSQDTTPNYDLAEYRNQLLVAVAPGEPSRRDRVDKNTRDELVVEYKVMAGIVDHAIEVIEGFRQNNPSGGPTGTITYQEVEREVLVPEQMDKLTTYQRKLVEQRVRLVVDQCAAVLRTQKMMSDPKQWASDIFETSLYGDVDITSPTPSTINITFYDKRDYITIIGSGGLAAFLSYSDPRITKNAPDLRGCIIVVDGSTTGALSGATIQSHEWRHRANSAMFPEHIDHWGIQNEVENIRKKIGDPNAQVPEDWNIVDWWQALPDKTIRDVISSHVGRIVFEHIAKWGKEEVLAYTYSNHISLDQLLTLLTQENGIYDYLAQASGGHPSLRTMARSSPEIQTLVDSVWQSHVHNIQVMLDTLKQLGTVDAAGHVQLDPKTFNLLAITPHKHWKYLLATPRPRVATSPAPVPTQSPTPAPTPTPPTEQTPTPTPERRQPQPLGKKKAYLIDVSEIAKAYAWREAEEKLRVLLDNSNMVKRWWVRSSEKGYLIKFYQEALSAIQSNKNLLTQIEAKVRGDSNIQIDAGSQDISYQVLDAVIRQFAEEINQQNEKGAVVSDNATINSVSADLFYRHAMHPMTRQAFDEELEHQLLPLLHGKNYSDDATREREARGLLFANNFWELAQEYRARIQELTEQYPGEEEKVLTHLRREMALDIQLGLKQRDLYDNKPKEVLTRFEKYVDFVENIPVLGKHAGKVLANPVAYGVLGGFVGNALFRRGAKAVATAGFIATVASTAPAWAPLLASMAVGGAFVAMRRMRDLKYDRGLAIRQSTLGAETVANDRQRKALERFHYDHIKAETVIPRLDAIYAQSSLADADRDYVADIMARIQVEQKKSVDLIGVQYGLPHKTKEIAMTDVKIRLRDVRKKFGFEDDDNLPVEILNRFNNRKNALVSNIQENDKAFDRYKRGQAVIAGLAGVAVGGLAGTVGQFAWFKGLEAVGHAPKTDSYIEALWHHMTGSGERGAGVAHEVAQGAGGAAGEVAEHAKELAPRPGFHDVHVDLPGAEDVNVKIPDGMNIIPDSKGDGFDLVNEKGKVIFENLHFNPDGSLTEDTISQLKEHGFNMEDVITKESKVVDPMDYVKDMLDKHARADWHDEPGKRFSNFFNRLIEFEGKQQMGYVHKSADGKVYFDIRGIANNLMKNAENAFDKFGRNPDGSFDSKLEHLRDQLRQWNSEGSLLKHLQLAIFPTDELNKKGLSILVDGASPDGRLTLPPEIAKLFTTEQSLHYLHHPVKFMEIRLDGHALATTIGNDMTKQLIEATIHNPLIMPPAPGGPVESPWALPFWKRNQLKAAPLRGGPSMPPRQPTPDGPERTPDYYRGEVKKHYTDMAVYRHSLTESEKFFERFAADSRLKGRYDYLIKRYHELQQISTISAVQRQKYEKELEKYNKQYGKNNSLDAFVQQELRRIHYQIENIYLEETRIGLRPFEQEYYDRSPLIAGIERAEEIVVILDHPIGDAVLTTPMIMALHEYMKRNNISGKPIRVFVANNQVSLMKPLENQFPGVSVYGVGGMKQFFVWEGRKERFLINADKNFESYDILGLSENDITDSSRVMSIDYASWRLEEAPRRRRDTVYEKAVSKGITRYDMLPARILRNFEVMFGQKLFDNINKIERYWEPGHDFPQREQALRDKYNIQSGERVIVVSAGSSVMPKEYHPDQWEKVFDGICTKYPDAHIVFLDDTRPERVSMYSEGLVDRLIRDKGYHITRAKEDLGSIGVLVHIADMTITPDTGIGHISSMYGTPNIMMILGNPITWSGPATRRVLHPVARGIYKQGGSTYNKAWADEYKSSHFVEENGRRIGASDIDPQKVLAEVDKVLSRRSS